jgi:hypothetical protein
MVIMIGALTQMRLGNAAVEDLAHVIGMNRLRAAPARRHGGGSMRLGLPWHLRSTGRATSPSV